MILGQVVPNFTADSTIGLINFYEFINDRWTVFFSHPRDFTPVCTTELGTLASLIPEFTARNTKVLALSCDSASSHSEWIKDIECTQWANGRSVEYPIIADESRSVAKLFGMIPANECSTLPVTCRSVFVIGPDKVLKASIMYPITCGRNFNEILRLLDSLQTTLMFPVATPANWERGDKVMIIPTLSNEEAKSMFSTIDILNVPSKKEYLRQCEIKED